MVKEHEWYRLVCGPAEWKGHTWNRYVSWVERANPKVAFVEVRRGPFPTPERARELFVEAVQQKLAAGYQWASKERFGAAVRAPAPALRRSKPWPKERARAPSWLAKVPALERQRVRAILEKAKLEHRANDIMSLSRPAIRFTLKTQKAPASVTTRFGGAPDCPEGFVWPHAGRTPLAFVAQFRLDALTKLDLEGLLPRAGVLSVFAQLADSDDVDAGESGRVFHFPKTDTLVRTVPRHSASDDGRPTKMALATASLWLTLPALGEKRFESLRLDEDEEERYDEQVLPAVRLARSTPSKPGAHQLLGWADTPTPSNSEQLLGQLDSDGRFGFEVGDVETLRLWIPSKKLAVHDFARTRFTVQAD